MFRVAPSLLPLDQSKSSGVCETPMVFQRCKLQATLIQMQKPVESGSEQDVKD